MKLQVVLLAAVLGFAVALPTFFPDRVDPDAPCDAHPDQGYKGHGAPVQEDGLEFKVENADGSATTKFCPGNIYSVTVSFSSPIKCKLSVSLGGLAGADGDCPNLQNFLKDDSGATASEYTTAWTVPCDAADSESVFIVTAATSSSGKYMRNKLTLKQKDECGGCN